MDLGFIVLVDDEVACSDWEQELYRMGVPPEMDVYFETVDSAVEKLPEYGRDPRPDALLTGDVETMARLVEKGGAVPRINLGGIHYRADRTQRLRYIFLTPQEERDLRSLASRGIEVTAQDVPAARPLPLADVLTGEGNR